MWPSLRQRRQTSGSGQSDAMCPYVVASLKPSDHMVTNLTSWRQLRHLSSPPPPPPVGQSLGRTNLKTSKRQQQQHAIPGKMAILPTLATARITHIFWTSESESINLCNFTQEMVKVYIFRVSHKFLQFKAGICEISSCTWEKLLCYYHIF